MYAQPVIGMDVKINRHTYSRTAAMDLIDPDLQQVHKGTAVPKLFDMVGNISYFIHIFAPLQI